MEADENLGWMSLLDAVGKGLLLCYGIGYFVEAVYDSVFGIYDLELIRTRAIFSGVGFVFFSALVYLVFKAADNLPYLSHRWRFMYRELARYSRIPRHFLFLIYFAARLTLLVEVLQLSVLVVLLAFMPVDRMTGLANPSLLHQWISDPSEKKHFLLLGIQAACCAGALITASSRLFLKWPRAIASLTVAFCLAYALSAKLIGQVPPSLTAWILVTMGSAEVVKKYSAKRTSHPWMLRALVACLASLLIYARAVYPHILLWLGGPPRATLLIKCRSCNESGKVVRLIEETSDGYYVVPYDDETRNALFIPRSNVDEAIFSSSPEDLLKHSGY